MKSLLAGRGADFFTGQWVGRLRSDLVSVLSEGGFPPSSSPEDVQQPLEVRLLQSLLRAAGDPEE